MVSGPLGDYQQPGKLARAAEDIWRGEQMLACPTCTYRFDAFGNDGGEPRHPENGDWTVCLACGAVARFVVGALGLLVREATPEELAECHAENPDLFARLARFHAEHPPDGWREKPD